MPLQLARPVQQCSSRSQLLYWALYCVKNSTVLYSLPDVLCSALAQAAQVARCCFRVVLPTGGTFGNPRAVHDALQVVNYGRPPLPQLQPLTEAEVAAVSLDELPACKHP